MSDAAAVLDALGHPSRRLILESLRGGPLPVGVLAERLPISRPAVSQHLRVLREADLVQETVVGTRHEYRLDARGLQRVREWADSLWGDTLAAFADLAASEARGGPVPEEPS
ncbi:metalloregulator ArsR/SmtB family transcription factor [Nakamurella sp. YIM 132087]|uniref:Metalloregulator ArsR/SmtB family transcription factor n=1 Tax=Nakamurella alba TaxID=2665158 RepID=A0A7K1FGL5_9ACTN|nr:metalloregulator ArsR/SmtB family transcription factor [Nakamurella alba]MTD13252.1 metalloregulator ArsR/SmtB family transcription factor [Nakamurella alba]